jgi:hypothetical protein
MSVAVVVFVVTVRPMHMWVLRIRWAMTMIVVRVFVVVMSMCIAMAMVVTTPMLAISTVFGLKTFAYLVDDEVHRAQHVGQHMVGLNLQMIGLQLNGHMAVAQVVGGAGQVKRRAVRCAMGDAQHRLRRGQHFEQRTVFAHQHIATAHHLAAMQKNTHLTPRAVGGFKAAFLPHIPVQRDGRGAFEQCRCQALALSDEFGEMDHVDLNGVRFQLLRQKSKCHLIGI